MRYAAPSDVSGITLSTGPLTVVDDFVDVPDGATPGDLGGLAVYGFTPAPTDAEPATAAQVEEPAADAPGTHDKPEEPTST